MGRFHGGYSVRGAASLICFFLFCCGAFSQTSQMQDKPAEKPAAPQVSPSSGARLEFLDEVSFYEQRYIRLAEAIPADNYQWRPGPGVRSVSEVVMHIAIADFGLLNITGVKLPAGFTSDLEKSVTSKTEALDWLKRSLEAVKTAHLRVRPSDLRRKGCGPQLPRRHGGRDVLEDPRSCQRTHALVGGLCAHQRHRASLVEGGRIVPSEDRVPGRREPT